MKLTTLLLAAVAFLAGAGHALADRTQPNDRDPGRSSGRLDYSVAQVEYEADVLVQILTREGADARVTYNARLVLDYSLALLDDLRSNWGRDDFYYTYDLLLDAHRSLKREWNYSRDRPTYFAEQQLRNLDAAVRELRRDVERSGGGVIIRN